jgi:hypothetical protein
MTLDRKLELVPLTFIGILVLILFIAIAIGSKEPSKYTIWSQNNAYYVDAFSVYGGQLVLEEDGKRVIIKGNYIIEINR